MHELSMASAVMETVLEIAGAHPAAQVLKVRLAIGELTHLQPEQLRFCYGAITERTRIAGSILEIETVSAEIKCSHCGYRGPPKYWREAWMQIPVPTLQCPECGNPGEISQGQECAIRGIQYVMERAAPALSDDALLKS